jgi:hypothetical protein
VLQLADPEFTLNAYEYERHRSNDSFRNSPRSLRPGATTGHTTSSQASSWKPDERSGPRSALEIGRQRSL